MDEIEHKEMFSTAVDAASRVPDPAAKAALSLVLQLIEGLNQRIIEMNLYEDQDEC